MRVKKKIDQQERRSPLNRWPIGLDLCRKIAQTLTEEELLIAKAELENTPPEAGEYWHHLSVRTALLHERSARQRAEFAARKSNSDNETKSAT